VSLRRLRMFAIAGTVLDHGIQPYALGSAD
jgi:hypothetical protein